MEKARIVRALAAQQAYCEGRSPLYAAVLRELVDDAADGPPWLEAVAAAWSARDFAVEWEVAHLLLACLHFFALTGRAPELAAFYPSCGGSGAPDGRVRAFMRRAPAALYARARDSRVQTNEVGRSVAWMVAAAELRRRGLPFHLVEIGASAGLNLVGDRLAHACRFTSDGGAPARPPAGWEGPHDVLTRTGLDLFPRRLSDGLDFAWLRACVWADDLPRLRRLELAASTFWRMEADPAGPRLARCAFADAPEWLHAQRPPAPGEGLLVFNSIATVYLGDAEYARLQEGMAQALAPWQERALWVEYERPRGAEGPLELKVHRAAAGGLRTRVLASGAPYPRELRLHPPRELLTEGEPA